MSALHYGKPLTATVSKGRLVIEIGVNVLAHAARQTPAATLTAAHSAPAVGGNRS